MRISGSKLRNKIIDSLKSQGFKVNPHLRPKKNEKDTLRRIHKQKRNEQLKLHRNFLLDNFEEIKQFSVSGEDLSPEKIDLKLIEVKSDSIASRIFLWWNLIWWSLPFDKSIGRQMRFILWDDYHNAPFGLVGLQSPPLKSSVRDNFLGLNQKNIDYWINQSMYGQRIGALPPYNELLGGKMVALSLVSNELREIYTKKYDDKKTLLEKRKIPNRILFTTTTSAYGKSSVYERLAYNGMPVSKFIGYTSGSGTFHLPESIYEEMLLFLQQKGIDTKRGYGTGPSRKLKLVDMAFNRLKIPTFTFHNIKRGYYLFPNAINLRNVLHKKDKPVWYDRPFMELTNFWKERWCIPRSNRVDTWRQFDSNKFFRKTKLQLKRL